jgi:signal transduction histidine kinase
MTQLENRYIDENKSKRIQILEQDKKIQELKINQYKTSRKIYILIIIIGLTLFAVAFFISRYNRKIARIMKSKNAELEMANKLLIESETKLIESNQSKDKFFSIISHDIKNSFNVILGITQVLAKKNQTIDDKKKQYYNEIVYKASRNLYDLLENLLNWSKTQTGKIEYNPEVFKLNEVINSTIEVLKVNAMEKNINIATNIDVRIKRFLIFFSETNFKIIKNTTILSASIPSDNFTK